MARIVVGDPLPLIRLGLKTLLEQDLGHRVVAEAEDRRELLNHVARESPDLLLMEIYLGLDDGLDLIREVHTSHPEVGLLTLSTLRDGSMVRRILNAGALGYVVKQNAMHSLRPAINAVLQRRGYVCPSVKGPADRWIWAPAAPDTPQARLSNRELHVYRLVGQGLSNKAIAHHLNLSRKTVESHKHNLKNKLGVSDAGELRKHAARWVENHARGFDYQI